ncbi:MAG: ISAs1 family transposase [Akkermansia sp.]|nr:ISAs1 family transposase [Akkermansia sp.]
MRTFSCSNQGDEKSNEITAIPKLLDMIDIEGCTISIDAMGCQKDIAAKTISKKADYILAGKDNQPTLRLDALLMSKHCSPDDDFIDTDAGHGRVEQRRTRILQRHGLYQPVLAWCVCRNSRGLATLRQIQ